MKKLLIYGFKPYKHIITNASEEIIKKLDESYKVILPLKFDDSLIINKIEKIKPDVIIGLSSSREGRLLRLERKAKNIIKLKKSKTKKLIDKNGPEKYYVNLKIKKIKGTRISYNAGTYTCNYMMYSVINHIKKNKLDIKYAYIHIPRNFKTNKALKIIQKLIKNIKKEHL